VVNVHAHAEQMQAHLARVAPEVLVSVEAERLETGGGLKRALPLLGPSPVFGLNADMVWRGANPFLTLAAAWDAGRMDGLLCLVPRAVATGHAGAGDFFLGADGRLERRGEAAAADYVYAGAQIIETGGLARVQEQVFSLNLVWDSMLAEGRLYGVVHGGGWADVGTPAGIALAEAALAR
jgi:MurNAc alpha-1-phosphate uridylyltransferase